MSGSETLADWLRARLADDERVAQAAESASFAVQGDGAGVTEFLFQQLSEGRALRDVAAKRAILARVVHDGGWELRHGVENDQIETYYWATCSCGWEQEVYRNGDIEDAHDRHRDAVGYNEAVAADIVRALAQAHRGEPGWREEWDIDG